MVHTSDCAGSRFATCRGLNVRDSSKESECLDGMTLSLGNGQSNGSRCEWRSQADVVAGKVKGGQRGADGGRWWCVERLLLFGGLSSSRTACTWRNLRVLPRNCGAQVHNRYPLSHRPTRQPSPARCPSSPCQWALCTYPAGSSKASTTVVCINSGCYLTRNGFRDGVFLSPKLRSINVTMDVTVAPQDMVAV